MQYICERCGSPGRYVYVIEYWNDIDEVWSDNSGEEEFAKNATKKEKK